MSKVFSKYFNDQFPFWVFTLGVFIIAILPSLVQDGMFIDGIQYAVVSKNFANGLGTFWFPHITQNWNTMDSAWFLENPPLVYAIQGLFFKIFGDGLYTERIYCLCTALVAAFLITRTWNLTTQRNEEIRKLSWLPVLIWVSMPIVFRSYQMNVQENTMGIFILASVYFVLKGLWSSKHSRLYIFLGGVSIFLATLCKGVTGLFPLAAVALFWLAGGRIRFQRVLFFSLILLLVPVLFYILLLLNDNAYKSFSFYYESRLLERIVNDPVVNSHFHIFFRLLLDLLPAIVVAVTVFLIRRKKVSLSDHSEEKRHAFFFLLMGLAGSVPLTFTLVQRDFYLGPSLPFFALGLSLFLSLYLVDVLMPFSQKSRIFNLFRVFSISLLIGGLVYTGLMVGKAGRDRDILHDTYLFGGIIEEGSRVHLEAEVSQKDSLRHWNLELYLARYFNISLGAPLEDAWYIIFFEGGSQPEADIFERLPLDTETYLLYQRKN
jgi:hypothetical protein